MEVEATGIYAAKWSKAIDDEWVRNLAKNKNRAEADFHPRRDSMHDACPEWEVPEENELELLALVIEQYEKLTFPPIKADPIELILFRIQQMKLTRKDMMPYFGSPSKVSKVLKRKRPLSLSMIRKLHQGLGIPVDILIEDIELNSLKLS